MMNPKKVCLTDTGFSLLGGAFTENRGRDGTVVFIPPLPELEETGEYVTKSGFRPLDGNEFFTLKSEWTRPLFR